MLGAKSTFLLLIIFPWCFESTVAGTVRQCTCDELFECKSKLALKLPECINKCKTTSTSELLAQSIHCIQAENDKGNDCVIRSHANFCTTEPNKTIDTKEILEAPGTGVVRKILHQKIQNQVNQNGARILESLANWLPQNETEVKSCLTGCVTDDDGVLGCLKERSCSLKKPDSISIITLLPLCRQLTKEYGDNLCQCTILKTTNHNSTSVCGQRK